MTPLYLGQAPEGGRQIGRRGNQSADVGLAALGRRTVSSWSLREKREGLSARDLTVDYHQLT